jgi:DNA-binding LacI/PurR family transcriptional regulator
MNSSPHPADLREATDTRPVTVRDVAEAAGVSIGTVSRALKNQPGLSATTRAEVLRVAAALSYDMGKLRGSKPRRIVLAYHRQMGPAWSNPFYSQVLHGVEQACHAEQVSLSLMSVTPGEDTAPALRRHEPDAIIVAGFVPPDVLGELREADLPLALIDHFHSDCYSVNDDNLHGSLLATRHLIEQGCQHVAMLVGPAHHSVNLRVKGYRKALFEARRLADPDHEVALQNLDTVSYETAARTAMASLLALPQRPDAVFAYNDTVALHAMALCQERGLRVPEDIAFAGYDDIDDAGRHRPALTTVRVDKVALGHKAAMALIQGQVSPRDDLLPIELVVRESSLKSQHRS